MKLSIITVNLNNKDGLQKTIDSVICQTYKDFEWIIIDGGSTDGSRELIEQFSNYISYWESEPDEGIYNAMNKGILQAHGDYIQFLNSGDYLLKNNTLFKIFKHKYDEDIIFGNIVINNNNIIRGIQSNTIFGSDLIKSTINHPSSFIRRSLFIQHGLYDEQYKIVADWKFFFEAILYHHCSVRYLDIEIVYFDMSGVSSVNINRVKEERLKVLNLYLPDYVIQDYKQNLYTSILYKYSFSRYTCAFLYRMIFIYQIIKRAFLKFL